MRLHAAARVTTPLQEETQEAFDRQLRGRADVILRGEEATEIQDYKTGSLFEYGTEELKASYVTQMYLYAALEDAVNNRCPEVATLIPLEGDPISIEIDPEVARAAADRAIAGLRAYNAAVEAGVPADELGDPGLETCRFCPYAVRCPCFWAAATPEWAKNGVVAIAGPVQDVQQAQRGTVGLRVEVTSGSVDPGEAWITQVDPDRFYPAVAAEPGSSLGATGLLGDQKSRTLRTSDRTRIAVASQRLA